MATTTPAQQTALSHLYIALFNRAPDATGFAFWSQTIAGGGSPLSIIDAFLTSPESTALYPASQSATDFVSALYQNVFGRAADAGGLAFWTHVLDEGGGVESSAGRALMVSKIVELVSTPMPIKPADLSDAQYAETVMDREIFSKKVVVSIDFATNLKSDDLVLAKQVLANLNVRAAPATPTAPAAPVWVNPAKTFVLTTGGDTFTGTAFNDTFNGPDFSGVNSLNTHDDLDGGDGVDTLNVRLVFAYREIPTLNNIEVVKVTTLTAGAELDLRNATGVTYVGITDSAALSDGLIYNVGAASLSVANQTANVAFTGSTATTLALSLSQVGTALSLSTIDLAKVGAGVGNGAGALATTHNIEMSNAYVALAETKASAAVIDVNVAATGANALTLSVADAGTVKHLTVTGNGSVDFSGRALSALETFTAGDGDVTLSSSNAAQVLDISTGAGVDTISANGASIKTLYVGAGNDVVTLYTGALSADARVSLGAGNDVITLAFGSVAGAEIDGGDGDDIINTGAVTHAVGGPGGSVDTLTGGNGADTFVFTTADVSSTAGAVTAVITDFVSGTDKIVVSNAGAGSVANLVKAGAAVGSLAAVLSAADAALDGTVHYYVGQVGADSYLVTDIDGAGYTNVIKLADVALAGVVAADLVA